MRTMEMSLVLGLWGHVISIKSAVSVSGYPECEQRVEDLKHIKELNALNAPELLSQLRFMSPKSGVFCPVENNRGGLKIKGRKLQQNCGIM